MEEDNFSMFDLHVHTTASDGTLTPSELISLAKKNGLNGVAITDHDTIAGIEEGIKAGKDCGIKVVPGIELSCYWEKKEVHILGYFIEFGSSKLIEKLKYLQLKRRERIEKMIDKAQHLGYKVTFEDVQGIAAGEAVGRPHFAQALINNGYISSVKEGFEKLLKKNKPLYVPRTKLTPIEAIDIINNANGVPVLAHPGLYNFHWKSLLTKLINVGLAGIEVYYPSHDNKLISELKNITNEYKLVATGGSDFHGFQVKENILGSIIVEEETVKYLKERKNYVNTSSSY